MVRDALFGGFAFEELDRAAAQREGHLHGVVVRDELVGGGSMSVRRPSWFVKKGGVPLSPDAAVLSVRGTAVARGKFNPSPVRSP